MSENSLRTIAIFAAFVLLQLECFGQNLERVYESAKTAYKAGDYIVYDALMDSAYTMHPYHQNILWHRARAAALTGQPGKAIESANRAIVLDSRFDLSDSCFTSIRKTRSFQKLIRMKVRMEGVIGTSDTAFTINDKQLHLESVAYDPTSKAFYCGSIYKRKIIKVENGNISDFVPTGYAGLGSVFSIRIDTLRQILWAISSPTAQMMNPPDSAKSALYKFDLRNNVLVSVSYPSNPLKSHAFGDLVLGPGNTPYVSDSENNIIYKYDSLTTSLVPFYSSEQFWNIQGICFNDDHTLLYVSDYIKGIFVLNIQKSELKDLKIKEGATTQGTDGMCFYANSLIILQNGVRPFRVSRLHLTKHGTEVKRIAYLERNHPVLGEPTIGTIHDHEFFYVASSQWDGYVDGVIKPDHELKPIVVLRNTLRK